MLSRITLKVLNKNINKSVYRSLSSTPSTLSTASNENQNSFRLYQIFSSSKFSYKSDLEYVLNDIEPHSVDAILDDSYFPLGQWIIYLKNSHILPIQQKYITDKNYFIKPISAIDVKRFQLASKIGVNNKTVRMRGVQGNVITEDEILYYFENYGLKRDNIKKLPSLPYNKKHRMNNNETFSQYLLTFNNEYDAYTAARDKNYGFLEGKEIFLYWYDI